MYSAVLKMLENNEISGKAKVALQNLCDNFEKWRQNMQAENPDEIASQVLEDSGYLDMLQADKSVEAPGRIENLKELINVMSDEQKYQTLADFMEHVSLVMDKDDDFNEDKVMLITLHSAKGLEFDVVFLPGWEEGLFPHQRCLEEGGENSLEEERRLAYVAITRARKKLYISMAHNRRIYGQWQNNLPSRFINELPPQNIEIVNKSRNYLSANTYKSSSSNYQKPWYNKPKAEKNYDKDSDRYSYVSNDEFEQSWGGSIYKAKQNAKNYTSSTPVGTKVQHQTFGIGKVVAIDGNKLEIIFEKYGHKKLMKDYVSKI